MVWTLLLAARPSSLKARRGLNTDMLHHQALEILINSEYDPPLIGVQISRGSYTSLNYFQGSCMLGLLYEYTSLDRERPIRAREKVIRQGSCSKLQHPQRSPVVGDNGIGPL